MIHHRQLITHALTVLACTACAYTAHADIRETAVNPVRILWMSDSTGTEIRNADVLLQPFSGQVSVNNAGNSAVLTSTPQKKASILLDFGKEIYGGLKIYSGMSGRQTAKKLHVCLGESVTEAMSDVSIADNPQNPTNEHSMRDFTVYAPWLGSVECGKSGFRFARIDLLDTSEPFPLRFVEARSFLRDDPRHGSFQCSDKRLNDIWETGAYTVHLNMQDYVWDGIKRDRLVWLGDMHPEVMTIATVWGDLPVVRKSLDYAVNDTPLPGWMNGMCSYSIWWMIIQRDLYLYHGNAGYLRSVLPYIKGLAAQIDAAVDSEGREHLDGARFIDWPSSPHTDAINSGMQSLTFMAIQAASDIAGYMSDTELKELADRCITRMEKVKVESCNNKQAAALGILSGRSADMKGDVSTIIRNGVEDFSTFYGYYMLEALARTGKKDKAMKFISDYWGAMLDLGATTFWEDLKFSDVADAARIDGFVPEGKRDIHADGGDYCYKGLRMSLCHGWASGPTAWMSRHILGIRPIEPGCATIEVDPWLGNLEWAKGTFPTPKGEVSVDVKRLADGTLQCRVQAPEGIRVINRATGSLVVGR